MSDVRFDFGSIDRDPPVAEGLEGNTRATMTDAAERTCVVMFRVTRPAGSRYDETGSGEWDVYIDDLLFGKLIGLHRDGEKVYAMVCKRNST